MKAFRKLAALTASALLLVANTSCMRQMSFGTQQTTPRDSSDGKSVSASWYEGGDGYHRAWQEWKQSKAPALIYFHTDWCGYCREFERELLSSDEVKEYLQNVVKVRINPEDGSEEREVANMFGVTGYPSIFFFPNGASKPIRLARYKRTGGEAVPMSPTEFVQSCRALE